MAEASQACIGLAPDAVWIGNETSVVVESSNGSALLSGEDAEAIAGALFDLVDGTRGEQEIARALPEFAAEDIFALLSSLKSRGLVVETAAAPPVNPPSPLHSSVQLLGDPALVAMAAEAFRLAGVATTAASHPSSAMSDFVVGLFRAENAEEIDGFSRAALSRDTPSLTCIVETARAVIGPLIGSAAASPCPRCAWSRLEANRRWRPSTDAVLDIEQLSSRLAQEVKTTLAAGWRAARLNGRVLLIDEAAASLPRRVLGVPDCPVCSGPVAGTGAGTNGGPLGWLIDARVGIVNRLLLEPPASPELGQPRIVSAIPADTPAGPRLGQPMPSGWGKGVTLSQAAYSAVGEAVERYAASMPAAGALRWARLDALEGDVLSPTDFPLYSPEQYARKDFPYVPFDPSAAHPWVRGTWFGTVRPVWLPAVLVYLSLEIRAENAVCQGSSSGLAAHRTFEEASLRAVLELIERDAFLLAWRGQGRARRVDLDSTLDREIAAVVQGMTRSGAEVEVLLLDGACDCPVAACMGFGDGVAWPGASIGISADPSPRRAIRQAILELGQTGPYLRRLMRTEPHRIPRHAEQVTEMLDHARYYFPAERARAFDPLRDISSRCALSDLPETAGRWREDGASWLGSGDIRFAVADVTSPDIALTGFRVARALSPDLQPIAFGWGFERQPVARFAALGGSRKGDVAPIW